MPDLRYLDLGTTDAAFNLAAEQHVFDSLPRDKMYFMLWQNRSAVIIGKYQNTLAEINQPFVQAHGIQVVRRLSGGGAVYHDLGNLNFTFIADAGNLETLDMKLFCEPVLRTLSVLGVQAGVNGRNDMTINGQKFSGNSQCAAGGSCTTGRCCSTPISLSSHRRCAWIPPRFRRRGSNPCAAA